MEQPREVNIGTKRFTKITSVDERGAGNAFHEYLVRKSDDDRLFLVLSFQKGPIEEAGPNGVFVEDLIAICIDRLQCFQEGPGLCAENAVALTNLRNAMRSLNARTAKRIEQNVEGTSTPHK